MNLGDQRSGAYVGGFAGGESYDQTLLYEKKVFLMIKLYYMKKSIFLNKASLAGSFFLIHINQGISKTLFI